MSIEERLKEIYKDEAAGNTLEFMQRFPKRWSLVGEYVCLNLSRWPFGLFKKEFFVRCSESPSWKEGCFLRIQNDEGFLVKRIYIDEDEFEEYQDLKFGYILKKVYKST